MRQVLEQEKLKYSAPDPTPTPAPKPDPSTQVSQEELLEYRLWKLNHPDAVSDPVSKPKPKPAPAPRKAPVLTDAQKLELEIAKLQA